MMCSRSNISTQQMISGVTHWWVVLYTFLLLPLPLHSQQPLTHYHNLREDLRVAQRCGCTSHLCTSKYSCSQQYSGNWSCTIWWLHLCLGMDPLHPGWRHEKVLNIQIGFQLYQHPRIFADRTKTTNNTHNKPVIHRKLETSKHSETERNGMEPEVIDAQ